MVEEKETIVDEEKEDEHKSRWEIPEAKFTIDLEKVDDGLSGHWWYYIRHDFAFSRAIGKKRYNALPVSEGSTLVHKQRVGADIFATTRYDYIMYEPFDKPDHASALMLDGKSIRKNLTELLYKYIKEKQKLPWACTIKARDEKADLNEEETTIHVTYEPIPVYVHFTLILETEKIGMNATQVRALPIELDNPLWKEANVTSTIQPIHTSRTIEEIASGDDKVCIWQAKITAVDTRVSTYQEHETRYYLLAMEDGTCSKDKKKSTLRKAIQAINVKASDEAMKELKFKVGDRVSFVGKLKMDAKLGLIIQGVHKFER